jgi:hypothetical protein
MSWTATYDAESDFVLTVYEGKMTKEELVAEEEESLALALANKTQRFLVDQTNYTGSISPVDLFESPTRYEEKLTRPIYVAVVEPTCEEARKDTQFYETVCRNRGWDVTVFSKKEAAAAWLEEKRKKD